MMGLPSKQKGAEIIEFALILPFLLLILFGIMEFGIVLYDKAIITNASREAARSGVAFKCPLLTTDQIQAVVTNYSTGLVSFSAVAAVPVITVTPTPPTTITSCGANSGTALTVSVSYSYNFLIFGNLFALFAPGFTNPLVLSASTVMNYE